MLSVRVSTNLLRFRFNAQTQKQIPFAASIAINATAKLVQAGERENMKAKLDNPTPFTLNSLSIQRSSKKSLSATVFVKDRAAWYLEPYEAGGVNRLNPYPDGGTTLLKPAAQRVNQYGNLPRGTTQSLKARRNTFVGEVFGVRGIWKRFPYLKASTRRLSKKNAALLGRKTRKQRPPQLLIQFADAHPATQQLNYRALAKQIVNRNFTREFRRAMAQAIATAKP
ncbi:hypothetical protein [Paraburkholderia sp. BR14320]|uniref:hypothetical protein n=1 Tax=unclassified Paraburkholderia TaxID=2615204 RepID=UPI0034CF5846